MHIRRTGTEARTGNERVRVERFSHYTSLGNSQLVFEQQHTKVFASCRCVHPHLGVVELVRFKVYDLKNPVIDMDDILCGADVR